MSWAHTVSGSGNTVVPGEGLAPATWGCCSFGPCVVLALCLPSWALDWAPRPRLWPSRCRLPLLSREMFQQGIRVCAVCSDCKSLPVMQS